MIYGNSGSCSPKLLSVVPVHVIFACNWDKFMPAQTNFSESDFPAYDRFQACPSQNLGKTFGRFPALKNHGDVLVQPRKAPRPLRPERFPTNQLNHYVIPVWKGGTPLTQCLFRTDRSIFSALAGPPLFWEGSISRHRPRIWHRYVPNRQFRAK